MSTARPRRPRHARPRAGAAYGSLALLRLHGRTGRRVLLAWPLGLAALVVATGRSIVALYPDAADRVAYAASAGASPGAVAFNGRWSDLETLGGITTNEVGFIGLILFPMAGVLLAIGRTRREEDSGRIEAVTARPVGRLAPLVGAGLVIAAAIALFAVLCAAGLVAIGLPVAGSIRYAALLAAATLAWTAIGLVCAEASRDARTATGLGLALVLLTFLARAVVDGAGWDAAWVSPSGWLPAAQPFGDSRAWPYAALLVLTAATAALAVLTAHRRDLAGGLLAPSPGAAHASPRLGTPAGYAWRLTRGTAYGWLAGMVVWGVSVGALTADMTEIARSNPQLLEVLGIDRAEDLITALTATVAALAAGALAIQGVSRLAGEEDSGRLGLVLATPVSRPRVWGTWAGVVAGQALALLLLQALVFGLAAWGATGDEANLTTSVEAALVLAVPVLSVLGGALAVRGIRPRWTGLLWAVIGWGAVVGFLAETLDLPGWARDLSPFHAVGRVPVADPRWSVVAALAVASAGLVVASVAVFARRDLRTG